MSKKILILSLVAFLAVSCKFDIVGPSKITEDSTASVLANWDPYIGVHAFNTAIQKPHLEKLIQAGQMSGARLDIDSPESQELSRWFSSRGLEVLGIFPNKYLRDPNVCQIFSSKVSLNGNINYWEIGNEVSGFINMNPEEYMKIFKKVFYYAKSHHPNITVINQPPPGNGGGADNFRRMIDAGLDDLCRDGLEIVSIHFYSESSTRIHEFKQQISRLPINTRIWITEANHLPGDWSKHIEYVNKVYPQLRNSLRAERIYWYVFSERSEFSLVKGLADGLAAEYSPLMNILVGETSTSTISNTDDYNYTTLEDPESIPTHHRRTKTTKEERVNKLRRKK